MYSGFNLSFSFSDENYYQKGLSLYKLNQNKVKQKLDSYISEDGSIDGSQMQADWFPTIDADVFISHSYTDEKTAIVLAGMFAQLGLKVFIDSCIWGYATDLLKEIDNVYCMNEDRSVASSLKKNAGRWNALLHGSISTEDLLKIKKKHLSLLWLLFN